jgi:putative glutamine amidotransferase
MAKFCLIFLFIFNFAYADLFVWQPEGHFQNWLLYKDAGEPHSTAIRRFLKANQSHSELQQFTQNLKFNPHDTFRPVTSLEATLLIANSASDHTQKAKRLRQVVSRFQDMEMSTLSLPVGALQSLSEVQKKRFFHEVSQHFQLLVALGGDDVHPEHYSEKITWAQHLKTRRDALEIELIQNYFKKSSGQILGFCRGLQITSVALGYKLNQDLVQDLNTTLPHKDGAFHSLKLLPTVNGLVSQIFSHQQNIYVNSYHHQSVQLDSLNPEGYLQIAALAADGVIEALEGRDGRVILFQFHPEMSDLYSQLGRLVFEYFKKTQKKQTSLQCRKAMSSFTK